MTILVLGAGGLGSCLAALLTRAGADVTVVARGEHGARIRESGLQMHGQDESFVVRLDCSESALDARLPDLVLVTVKAFSLEEVATDLAALAERGATVVTLLNGVDATDRLSSLGVRSDRLVAGTAYLTAFRVGPGVVKRTGRHARLVLGSPRAENQEQARRAAEAFRETEIEAEATPDIEIELWRKMAVVSALCVMCGLTGASLGEIRSLPHGRELQEQAVNEVLRVAEAAGTTFPPLEARRLADFLDRLPPELYPSLLHDLRSGRRTEIDALSGAVVRHGHALGVPTPLHEAATRMVSALESGREPA